MIDHNEAVLLREITVMQFTRSITLLFILTERQGMIYVDMLVEGRNVAI